MYKKNNESIDSAQEMKMALNILKTVNDENDL